MDVWQPIRQEKIKKKLIDSRTDSYWTALKWRSMPYTAKDNKERTKLTRKKMGDFRPDFATREFFFIY